MFTSTAVRFINASRRASIEPGRVRRERHVQRDDVGDAEQVVEIGDPSGDSGVVARVVEHLHAEARGAARDGLPDATEPDHAERAAVHVLSEEPVHAEAVPASLSKVGLRVGRAPRRRQHEEEREIGGGLVEDAGRVAHRDAELRGGRHVDVVVTHRHVGDHAEPRSAGPEHGGVDPVGEHAHDGVDLGGRRHQLVGRQRRVVAGPAGTISWPAATSGSSPPSGS